VTTAEPPWGDPSKTAFVAVTVVTDPPGVNSNAPASHPNPNGRPTPRWSAAGHGAVPGSISGLDGRKQNGMGQGRSAIAGERTQ
jgi:hypothetical protein